MNPRESSGAQPRCLPSSFDVSARAATLLASVAGKIRLVVSEQDALRIKTIWRSSLKSSLGAGPTLPPFIVTGSAAWSGLPENSGAELQ